MNKCLVDFRPFPMKFKGVGSIPALARVAACVNNHSKIPDLQKYLNKRLFGKKINKQAVMTLRHMKTSIKIIKCRIRTALAILFAGLMVVGCGTETSVYMLGAGMANFIQSDRMPQDFIAELVTGKECNTLAAIKDKGPLCRESFDPPIYEKPIYCYRTLGNIRCYEEPDPYGPTTQRVR